MDKASVKYSIAARSAILTKSGFNNYDLALNPYVGCEFGCSYCYVRFFVKDNEKQWGQFLRARLHLTEQLTKELNKGYYRIPAGVIKKPDGKKQRLYRSEPLDQLRLVIGTMTDPYQPTEKRYRLTRSALQTIIDHENQFAKVGIFTRSPLVLADLPLITKLPKARVHFTVTPFPPRVLRKIEPISPVTAARFKTVERLKKAGLRVHVNVSPVIPRLSERHTEEFAQRLAEIGVDEFFVDPMQPYKESFEAFREAIGSEAEWREIEQIMTDRKTYSEWKAGYADSWVQAWHKHGAGTDTLPIWSDHEHKVWVDMRTGERMDRRHYGEG